MKELHCQHWSLTSTKFNPYSGIHILRDSGETEKSDSLSGVSQFWHVQHCLINPLITFQSPEAVTFPFPIHLHSVRDYDGMRQARRYSFMCNHVCFVMCIRKLKGRELYPSQLTRVRQDEANVPRPCMTYSLNTISCLLLLCIRISCSEFS